MDIALVQQANGTFDIELDGPDLLADFTLNTGITLSLFLNRRADATDVLPDFRNPDYGGSWIDSYPQIQGDLHGSKLWLLSNVDLVAQTLQDGEQHSEAALEWVTADGWATSLAAQATELSPTAMLITVPITESGEDAPTTFSFRNQ